MHVIGVCLLVMLGPLGAEASAAERPLAMKDLPASVQATIKAETAGYTLKNFSESPNVA
jgi:hypothetical protein